MIKPILVNEHLFITVLSAAINVSASLGISIFLGLKGAVMVGLVLLKEVTYWRSLGTTALESTRD